MKTSCFVLQFVLVILFILTGKTIGNGFRFDGGEDDVIAVCENDGAGFSAAGNVDHATAIARVLDQTLDRRGIGADDGDDAVRCDHVAVSDADEFHNIVTLSLKKLFNILDLFADLFQFAFDFHNKLCDGNVASLGTDGVGFTIDFLKQEIEFSADGFIGK